MPTAAIPSHRAHFWLVGLECLITLTIVFLFVGSLPPGINESHYLPKAKHLWDSSFAAGNDIFLQSNDSHFLASLIAGVLAKWFELSSVAWICRTLAWLLLCLAWSRFCRAVEMPRLLRPLVLLCWLLLVRYGHLAGEWFVGGYEAKSLAYPLAIFGLSYAVESRWSVAWVWIGAATAFHPVVGGWVGVSIASIWLLMSSNGAQRTGQRKGLAPGCLLAMIGIVPALLGLGTPDREGPISAAQVHVYFRLAHHLCPRTFDAQRWQAAGSVVAVFAILAGLACHRLTNSTGFSSSGFIARARTILETPLGKLIAIAIVSVLISCVGWSIDQLGMLTGREDVAATLLRFYFFRWSDVAVPLATAVLAGWWLGQLCFVPGGSLTKDLTQAGSIAMISATILIGGLGFMHWRHESQQIVPPADRWMLQQTGPFPLTWEDIDVSGSVNLPHRYSDWLAVCEWIAQNTPADSLWITPKHQQTFKWYAQRAEVVSWKDVPQDNRSIIEWFRRIERLTQPRNSSGIVRSWQTEELVQLAQQYQCNWILLDRTYQDKPPLLECKYPINIDNRSFAVFYVSDAMLHRNLHPN